jgi:hypothetical protein
MTKLVLGVIASGFVTCVIACCGGAGTTVPTPPATTSAPTGSAEPADAPSTGEGAAAELTPEVMDYPPRPAIRGLTWTAASSRLVAMGFEPTGAPRKLATEYLQEFRHPRRDFGAPELSIEVWGPDPERVSHIEATVTADTPAETSQAAKALYGELASLRYERSDVTAAKRWVRANVDRNSTTSIGGVPFETFANVPTARMLEIGVGSPELAPEPTPQPTEAAPRQAEADRLAGEQNRRDGQAARQLESLLGEPGDLKDSKAIDAFTRRLSDFQKQFAGSPATDAAKREAAALSRLRLAYILGEQTGRPPTQALRDIVRDAPGTVAAKAAEARLSK